MTEAERRKIRRDLWFQAAGVKPKKKSESSRAGSTSYARKLALYKARKVLKRLASQNRKLSAAARSRRYTKSRRSLTMAASVAARAARGIKAIEPGCECGVCTACVARDRRHKSEASRGGFYWDSYEESYDEESKASSFSVELESITAMAVGSTHMRGSPGRSTG